MQRQLRSDLQPATVPSREFWGMTPFRFGIPAGWSGRQTTQHLVYLEYDGDPTTNCGVEWKRVAPSLSLQRLASMNLAATQRRFDEVAVGTSTFGTINGRKVYTRVAKLTQPDPTGDGELAIGQVYTAFFGPIVNEDAPIELIEITGHFPVGDSERVDDLEQFTLSFQFNVGVAEAVRDSGDTTEAV